MYNIEFYENQSGESELWNFLEKLRNEAATNKDSRIQYKQMMFYIELLQKSCIHNELYQKHRTHLNIHICS